MEASIGLRPVAPGDDEFLYRLYASTRAEELALVPWSAEQKEAFLRMQFRAQSEHYARHYAGARFLIVLRAGQPVGRLYLKRGADELRIVDVSLLPEARGQGLGTALLEEVFAEADEAGLAVRIHVEQFNRALRLYERLGFRRIGENGPYFLMERPPAAS